MAREWTGIQNFPLATQTKLLKLLTTLKEKERDSVTILVMGKGGVGKSSTINSILGERAVAVSAFQSDVPRPVMVSRERSGFTLNIIDTPGIVEGGYVNDQALELIKRFLLNKTIDVLLYVDRLDSYRVDNLDKQIIKAITDSFGKEIWHKGIMVLTHAQLTPPDCLGYDEFFGKRSEALLKLLDSGSLFRKREVLGHQVPVALVENSSRCNKNDNEEKILPNGTAWIPKIVEVITEVATNGSNSIVVDQKLIDGPNANERGKVFIPLILTAQYIFVGLVKKWIKDDIAKAPKSSWE
uniref:translocase of chloroplast 34-like n=1 Tax=Erigeron canadensis TaxID=72917 RepID=UPI001CB971DE|nr:translocase of chloroplast 34-like [Erigeron canadensis]